MWFTVAKKWIRPPLSHKANRLSHITHLIYCKKNPKYKIEACCILERVLWKIWPRSTFFAGVCAPVISRRTVTVSLFFIATREDAWTPKKFLGCRVSSPAPPFFLICNTDSGLKYILDLYNYGPVSQDAHPLRLVSFLFFSTCAGFLFFWGCWKPHLITWEPRDCHGPLPNYLLGVGTVSV